MNERERERRGQKVCEKDRDVSRRCVILGTERYRLKRKCTSGWKTVLICFTTTTKTIRRRHRVVIVCIGFKYWVTGMPQLSGLLASLEFPNEEGKFQDPWLLIQNDERCINSFGYHKLMQHWYIEFRIINWYIYIYVKETEETINIKYLLPFFAS